MIGTTYLDESNSILSQYMFFCNNGFGLVLKISQHLHDFSAETFLRLSVQECVETMRECGAKADSYYA